ncbi:hypothetical protein HDU67_002311 [Dinochytrium kinnereticum]|nr:hypothetical protein HDU67_002311 [Dinochytrium kinnereticum]
MKPSHVMALNSSQQAQNHAHLAAAGAGGVPTGLEGVLSPADSDRTLLMVEASEVATGGTTMGTGLGSTRRPPKFNWAKAADAKDEENEDFVYSGSPDRSRLRSVPSFPHLAMNGTDTVNSATSLIGNNSSVSTGSLGPAPGMVHAVGPSVPVVVPHHYTHNPSPGPKLKRSTEFRPPPSKSQNGDRPGSAVLSPTLYGTLAVTSPLVQPTPLYGSLSEGRQGRVAVLSTSTSDSSSTGSSFAPLGSLRMSAVHYNSQRRMLQGGDERAHLLAGVGVNGKRRDRSTDSQDSAWRASGRPTHAVVSIPVNVSTTRVAPGRDSTGWLGGIFGFLGANRETTLTRTGSGVGPTMMTGNASGSFPGTRPPRSVPLYSSRMERRRLARRRAQEKRRCRTLSLAMTLFLAVGCVLSLFFSTLPLSIPFVIVSVPGSVEEGGVVPGGVGGIPPRGVGGWVPSWGLLVGNLTARPDLFAFDMELEAVNWNVVPVDVGVVDLDVYASADAVASNMTTAVELLGHVKHFEGLARFPPIASSNVTGRIAIKEPSNTIGRIIYTTYPYRLTLVGQLTYSSTGPLLGLGGALFNTLFEHTVPICSVHVVESLGRIFSYPCDPGVFNITK